MTDSHPTPEPDEIQDLLLRWLEPHISSDGRDWLRLKIQQLQDGGEDWEFFSSFSAVPRHAGKKVIPIAKEDQQQADELRQGWNPSGWTADQMGRTLLVLCIAEREKHEFLNLLEKLFLTSDMGEAVALYQCLPVLPHPEALRERAAEGIRSNITSVFNAVALRNPYPADFLAADAWNQMVLKALFVGSPLYLIQGIDTRANKKLAQMLADYAHERWAAGRSVSPELWRPVGPFAEGDVLVDLQKVLNHSDEIQKQAALLALAGSPSEEARSLINQHEDIWSAMKRQGIDWDDIGRRVNERE
jgi:hypothetical protein